MYKRDLEKENEIVARVSRDLRQNIYKQFMGYLVSNPVIAAKALATLEGANLQFAKNRFNEGRKQYARANNIDIWCVATAFVDTTKAKEIYEEIKLFLSKQSLQQLHATFPEIENLQHNGGFARRPRRRTTGFVGQAFPT